MKSSSQILISSVLGGVVSVVGLWLLIGELSLPIMVAMVLGMALGLAWVSQTAAHVWAWTTIVLGLESIAWPVQMFGELRALGLEPPLEDMQRVFTAVLFGLFSGVFWLTFAYGIFRRSRRQSEAASSQSNISRSKSAKGKKKR
ncbi:MAG: hypothetical protein GKS05_09490 [Nitrospirales bacterium]|nr:hypothetical protein [Nitrospirales bacterium]